MAGPLTVSSNTRNCKFSVLYADPPWKFAPMGIAPEAIHKALASHSAAEDHYPTMTLEAMKQLRVGDVAAPSSVLFMWATSPFLKQALELMEAWGFRYKTCAFVWAKRSADNTGWAHAGGWYTLSGTELCLLGTRGKTLPRVSKNQYQLIVAPRSIHSAKPAEARHRIERIYGDVPKLELFAREHNDGWAVWGNEVHSDVDISPITKLSQ